MFTQEKGKNQISDIVLKFHGFLPEIFMRRVVQSGMLKGAQYSLQLSMMSPWGLSLQQKPASLQACTKRMKMTITLVVPVALSMKISMRKTGIKSCMKQLQN